MVLHPAIYMKYKASIKARFPRMTFSGMKLKGVYYYADEIRSIELAPALIFCQSSARLLLVRETNRHQSVHFKSTISREVKLPFYVEGIAGSIWDFIFQSLCCIFEKKSLIHIL